MIDVMDRKDYIHNGVTFETGDLVEVDFARLSKPVRGIFIGKPSNISYGDDHYILHNEISYKGIKPRYNDYSKLYKYGWAFGEIGGSIRDMRKITLTQKDKGEIMKAGSLYYQLQKILGYE